MKKYRKIITLLLIIILFVYIYYKVPKNYQKEYQINEKEKALKREEEKQRILLTIEKTLSDEILKFLHSSNSSDTISIKFVKTVFLFFFLYTIEDFKGIIVD